MLQLRSHVRAELAQLIRGHAVRLCNNGHLQGSGKVSASLPWPAKHLCLYVMSEEQAQTIIMALSPSSLIRLYATGPEAKAALPSRRQQPEDVWLPYAPHAWRTTGTISDRRVMKSMSTGRRRCGAMKYSATSTRGSSSPASAPCPNPNGQLPRLGKPAYALVGLGKHQALN